jgi:flagellar biosynthesis protein FliP
MKRRSILACVLALPLVAGLAAVAAAQSLNLNLGDGASSTTRIVQMVALLTILSLAPSILVMVTSFTRMVVVLSFLRSALGTQQTPPNTVLISLALFLTAFVMAPTLEIAYREGILPYMEQQIGEEQAFERSTAPVRRFMIEHTREQDLSLFYDLAKAERPAEPGAVQLRFLLPAFMISELRRAFEIGFLLFLPFLIIDIVVASILMSMGMMMVPPVMISLPFKLIFFVLVDGWHLVAGSLVQSYN